MRRLRTAMASLIVTGVIVLAGPGTARADEQAPSPVYRIDLATDLGAFVLGGVITLGWWLGDTLGPAACAPLCDRSAVNAFDRFAAGNYDERWALASDITVGGALAVGVVALFADQRSVAAFADLLVVGQSIVFSNALAVLGNIATRRPRPYLYSTKAPESVRESGQATFSFPSGHVAAVTALTSSLFSVLYARHPREPWPWLFLGFGTAASGAVAAGRILAGRHFLSDVIIAAAIGTGMGVLVPALHRKNVTVAPTATADSAGLNISGRF